MLNIKNMKERKNIFINKREDLLSEKNYILSNKLRSIYSSLKIMSNNYKIKNVNDYVYALATRFSQVNP